eukprot:707723-Rhodomonas_salina.1
MLSSYALSGPNYAAPGAVGGGAGHVRDHVRDDAAGLVQRYFGHRHEPVLRGAALRDGCPHQAPLRPARPRTVPPGPLF